MFGLPSPTSATLGAALIAGFLVAGAPAVAMETTQVPPAPVKIASCVVARDQGSSLALGRTANTAGVTIVVINDTLKTMKDIQLSGVYNGLTLTDTFTGPFKSGETYTLQKNHVPLAYEGPDAMCVLNHVTYADGSNWTMSKPPVSQR